MTVIQEEVPEGHVRGQECWCYPSMMQYQDGYQRWHNLTVHERPWCDLNKEAK